MRTVFRERIANAGIPAILVTHDELEARHSSTPWALRE